MENRTGYISLMAFISLVGCIWSVTNVVKFHRGESCQSDFLTFYAAGRLAFTGQLYDHNKAVQVYKKSAGCSEFPLPITRPAFFAAFMKPIAALPFPWAYRLWLTLCTIAVVGFVWHWPGDRWVALAVCAWSFPLMSNFVYGQDGPMMLLLTGLAIRFVATAPGRSATIFSLGAAKIHLFVPIAFWVAAGGRWHFARTLSLAGAVLLALSFTAGGIGWIPAWINSAMSPAANRDPEAMIGVIKLGALFAPSWLVWGFWAPLIALAFFALRRAEAQLGLALVPATGLLLTNHAFLYDVCLCIPLILMIIEGDHPTALKVVAFLACTPIIYLLPAPAPLVLNAQWLIPLLVIGTMVREVAGKSASFQSTPG